MTASSNADYRTWPAPDPDELVWSRQCNALTKDGRPCIAYRAAGRETCAAHDLDIIAGRRHPVHAQTAERAEAKRDRLLRRIAEVEAGLPRLREQLAAVEALLERYGVSANDGSGTL